MRVPRLTFEEKLDEADTALNEPAGDQAAAAVFLGGGVIEAIELLRLFGFAGKVERFRHGALHSRGGLEVRDARGQFCVLGKASRMVLVDLFDELELIRASCGRNFRGGLQVEDGRFAAAERRALVNGGEEAGRPVALSIDRQAARIGEDNIRGKIFIHRTEAVEDPGTHRRQTGEEASGVDDAEGRLVIDGAGGH